MELCCGPLASVGFRLWALVEGLSKALSRTLASNIPKTAIYNYNCRVSGFVQGFTKTT